MFLKPGLTWNTSLIEISLDAFKLCHGNEIKRFETKKSEGQMITFTR